MPFASGILDTKPLATKSASSTPLKIRILVFKISSAGFMNASEFSACLKAAVPITKTFSKPASLIIFEKRIIVSSDCSILSFLSFFVF